VDDPSDPAVIEMVDVAMRAYEYAHASELTLTSLSEVLQSIKGLKFGKVPGPNGVPNRVLKHLPKRATTFLTKVFNAILCRQYLTPVSKHANGVSMLNLGKDPTLRSSYRPIRLLDSVGKIFEKILLIRCLREVNQRGQLREEQFGFRPRHTMTLHLAHLVDGVKRNFDYLPHTGAVFLDVPEAFETVWIKSLLWKVTA
jgi:hypothetical protein